MTNASKAGDDLVRADSYPADSAEAGAPECFELEHQGQVYQLPNALKGGFLRQADYTRKTQELAAHKRALVATHQAVARQAQAAQGALGDRAHLAALDQWLRTFGATDWRTLAQQNPQRAQALWARFQQTKALRDRYAAAVSHYGAQAAVTAGRQAAQRMAQTGAVLQREIPGWSPELAGKLVDYAQGHGVTLEEMRAADDPRVWKIIHCAYQGDCANQRDGTARTVAQAQAVRPAIVVAGAAATGGGVRDELGTKEWMKRRNDLLGKKR
ncbi:MAG TPA: hypothetical protein VHW05_14500 [Phenylobacterium sp.]|jgi:hypothetical protein|nr:hypothetical protein [Phenylobacterium sp.]